MAQQGSRDHLWLLGGAAVMAAVVVLVAVLQARADDRASPALADRSSSAQPQSSTGTKMDRVPTAGLLPNLVVLPADELGVTGRGDSRVLRFASILANTGTGPLQIAPVPDEVCPPRQRYVEQRVFVDDAAVAEGDDAVAEGDDASFDPRQDRRQAALPGGCMLFHPRHEHWHFDASAAYALTAVGDDEPIVARDKVSFCLRDSEPLKGATQRHRRTYEECARNRRQGISVGWADRYDSTLAGQRLPLPPGLPDGPYCLRLEVDPFDLLTEADESDNTSAIVVDISARQVSRDPGATC